MTDFKAKMHQIRFRLGLRPSPAGPGGAYSAPPGTPSWIVAGEGTGLGKRRESGRRRGGMGKWREGKGRAPSYC